MKTYVMGKALEGKSNVTVWLDGKPIRLDQVDRSSDFQHRSTYGAFLVVGWFGIESDSPVYLRSDHNYLVEVDVPHLLAEADLPPDTIERLMRKGFRVDYEG